MAAIRVLFFTTRLGTGGAEKQLVRVANWLDPREFQVDVAVCRRGGEYENLIRPTIGLHHLAPRWIRSSLLGVAAAAIPLRRLVRELAPDVVCAFMDAPSIVASLLLDRSAGAPQVVACIQNTLSEVYADEPRLKRAAILRLARAGYPRADRIIALSHGVARDLIAQAPAVEPRVTVIHNAGVDDDLPGLAAAPVPESLSPDRERPLVVTCGRLAPQKGYPYLIDAFAEVHRSTGAHLWILGDGPERAEIEDRVARLGLSSAVRLLGFQSNPYAFMAASDLFVLSSLYEGFGNVIVEAMASGTPVVATDCPHGPAEIIVDGTSGLLVPPADAGALASAMRRVLTDRDLSRRLAEGGRRRAQQFHLSRIGDAYAAVFRDAARTRSTSIGTAQPELQ